MNSNANPPEAVGPPVLSEVLGDTATPASELKAAVQNAYGRGYYAGTRRKQKQISAEAKQRQEDALWHRYMTAALTACVTAGNWTTGGKDKTPINTLPERTKLAANFADEAVKLARQRGRL